MNLNKVTLAGKLTRDPELRYLTSGKAVVKFGIACNRYWKDESGQQKEEVAFIDCDAFGRTAENIGQYFKKGSPIYVEGRLRLETWDDKATGAKRSKLGVVLDTFQFVGGKDKSDSPTTPRQTDKPDKTPNFEAPIDGQDDVPF